MRGWICVCCCLWMMFPGKILAMETLPHVPLSQEPTPPPYGEGKERFSLSLSATLGSRWQVHGGLIWRVFVVQEEGRPPLLVASSQEAQPIFFLPSGDYFLHVAYGLASSVARVSLTSAGAQAQLNLRAGALRVKGLLKGKQVPGEQASVSIYVPEPGNVEAKLVLPKARFGDLIGLPEGGYHIVSTYYDKVGMGSLQPPVKEGIPTNSIVSADVKVETGKITDVILKHHAALITLKLVRIPNGDALADTNFTILTPGGDTIRELAGAYPALTLAEGEYIVIARNDGKTYQSTLTVKDNQDYEFEIVVK